MSPDTVKACIRVLAIHFIGVLGKRMGPDGGLHLTREKPEEEDSKRFVIAVGASRPWTQIGVMDAEMVDGVEWRVIELANNRTAKTWYELLVATPERVILKPWTVVNDELIAQPSSPRGMIC